MPEKINLAHLVSNHRKKHNLTQRQLAKKLAFLNALLAALNQGKLNHLLKCWRKLLQQLIVF